MKPTDVENASRTDRPIDRRWSPGALAAVNREFANASPEELLLWASDRFGTGVALATSFGPQSVALLHMLHETRRTVTAFYLDTGLLFAETHALRVELETRMGVRIERVDPFLSVEKQAERYGPELWQRAPDACCRLRKVLPLRRYLENKTAWITGIRRGQTPLRAGAQLVEWDAANHVVKINPLVDWSEDRLWSYLRIHGLPVNALHSRGYPSIGCWPCTRPVEAGNGPRSGRWAGRSKTECGIHVVGVAAAYPRVQREGSK